MNGREIKKFVYRYITKYKTQSAIMLTGEWGSGKSYFIQKELIPFLEEKEESVENTDTEEDALQKSLKNNCILISLYGLSTVQEISKSIYIEARTAALKNSALMQKAKDVVPGKVQKAGKELLSWGKTILKGISGIEIDPSGQNFDSLLETVNMEGKLIILEDLERTQIDILDLLGYINSLVEQDRIKVLLVSNEDKFLQLEQNDESENKKTLIKQYLRAKEKTISDTIRFDPDISTTIDNILESFDPELSCYRNETCIKEIEGIFEELGIRNFRSFIFACQKTVDILDNISQQDDTDYTDCLFYSTIAFSLRLKKGDPIKWPDDRKESSFELGTNKYPLFRFCYDYIVSHTFCTKKAENSKEILKDLRLYDVAKSDDDPDLLIIYDYSNQETNKVEEAIRSIWDKLEKGDKIAFSEYGDLALNLIHIAHIVGINFHIDEYRRIENLMIKNLHGKGNRMSPDILSRKVVDNKDPDAEEYKASMSKMIDSLMQKDGSSFYGFKYTLDTVEKFYNTIQSNPVVPIKDGGLIARMDLDRLMNVLAQCPSRELNILKQVFITVYRNGIPSQDMDNLVQFKGKLDELYKSTDTDAILKDNIKKFDDFIEHCIHAGNTIYH